MGKFLDSDGLTTVWAKAKAKFVEQETGKALSSNDYTTDEKTKLAGISEGANQTTVDTALSSTSTNPVQNKVVNEALGKKVDNDGLATTLSAYETKAELATDLAKKLDVTTAESTYATITTVNGKLDSTTAASTYATIASVDGKLDSDTAAETYATITTVNGKLDTTTAASTYATITSVSGKLDSTTAEATYAKLTALDDYAKKTDLANVYIYKGSVATADKLPTSATAGDVYNIVAESTYGPAGTNVAWTGSAWDSLGGAYDISALTTTEIEAICV